MGLTQFEETQPYGNAVAIVAATVLNVQNIVSALPRSVRIDCLTAINNDVIDHHVRAVSAPENFTGGDIGVVLVPAGAGYTTGPPVDLLIILQPQMPFFLLDDFDDLLVGVQEAVTSTFKVTVYAQGGFV